ncbi:hypothetical protein ACH4RA_26150 [Streptomyces smyrnaeus]|uniref:hypothetical protein n=1 Tax=Streptomyces TaxID=1883 RepID=UPI001B359918|nr:MULTISPECIES: hypothetical protein [unclassified Streptomyces]MBQ0865757.1 hypothetical protein [Streptomyces sp. RK75]MBQ1120654.1 hypothetical protein [Streptomyces sp. B15]MBQ1157460.1 hypothetical protein [Streptomyces sp. A73]
MTAHGTVSLLPLHCADRGSGEVADLVAFLAGDRAPFNAGSVSTIAGGRLAGRH